MVPSGTCCCRQLVSGSQHTEKMSSSLPPFAGSSVKRLMPALSPSGPLEEGGTYLRHGSSSPGSEDNDLAGDMDITYQQRMAAEFEAEFQQLEMEEESVADPRLRDEVSAGKSAVPTGKDRLRIFRPNRTADV